VLNKNGFAPRTVGATAKTQHLTS